MPWPWPRPATCRCGARTARMTPGPGPQVTLACDNCGVERTVTIPECPPYWHAWDQKQKRCRNCGTHNK